VRVDENTVRVVSDATQQRAQTARAPATGAVYAPNNTVHLAYAGAASQPDTTVATSSVSNSNSTESASLDRNRLETVVVSAEKRDERLQDVPVPVTAISAESLADSNQLRLQDYYTRVPGLSVTPSDFGSPQLTIRGMTTGGYTNPTVGITVDDVPFGSSSSLASGQEAPDLDPSDLARIEVLRGPQGTLYGASSLGGLVKFVTVDPSTEKLSGRVQIGGEDVSNGYSLGYSARGAVNVPLSDTFAVRASGYTRQDPGYIDNPFLGTKGVNEIHASGGHLSALWRPSEDISVKLSALIQRASAESDSDVNLGVGLGDLQQNNVRGAGANEHELRAYSATVKAKILGGELTAISGYSVNHVNESLDYTSLFGPTTNALFGVTGTPLISNATTDKFTQEIRFAASAGTTFDWLVGLFYNHEKSDAFEDLLATDAHTGAQAGSYVHIVDPSTFTEYAVFTDLIFHITDQFDIQVGGRESQNRQSYSETFIGTVYDTLFLGQTSPFVYPEQHTKDNSFTYLVTPQYKISPDLMLYARFASGYRPGGPNVNTASTTLPLHYNPDTTRNYEVGFKGTVLDHLLSFDASLYYIDWRNIQLQLIDPTTNLEYFSNGGHAKSEGVEFSVDARPLRGLTISAWITLNDAKLTETLPTTSAAHGVDGDRLPYSSRFSANLSLEQQFPITDRLSAFAGASESYVGDRQGVFTGTAQRQGFGAYAKTDLLAGVRYDDWTFNVFANNLTDRRGILTGGVGTTIPSAFEYIQPRTVGLSVTKEF